MAGFTEQALQKKLSELTNTLPSIQTLSLWLLHHRKHSSNIVKVWYNELKKERQPKRIINLVHLANDVIQNARKKWPLFQEQFQEVLEKAFAHVARHSDQPTLIAARRVIEVWRQRSVFDQVYLDKLTYSVTSNLSTELLAIFNDTAAKTPPSSGRLPQSPVASGNVSSVDSPRPPAAKRRSIITADDSVAVSPLPTSSAPALKALSASLTAETTSLDDLLIGVATPPYVGGDRLTSAQVITTKTSTSTSLMTTEERLISLRSVEDVIAQAPKTDEVIKALKALLKPASADVEARQRIAQFPADIADASKLSTLTTQFQAERFSQVVNEAGQVLKAYNLRLAEEMLTRSNLTDQLSKYIQAQRCLAEKDAEQLAVWKEKLSRLSDERRDLHQHVNSLPDLSKLPDFTRLPPLPSAGDLFFK